MFKLLVTFTLVIVISTKTSMAIKSAKQYSGNNACDIKIDITEIAPPGICGVAMAIIKQDKAITINLGAEMVKLQISLNPIIIVVKAIIVPVFNKIWETGNPKFIIFLLNVKKQ